MKYFIKYLFFIVVISFFSCQNSKKEETDFESDGLKGNVSQLTQNTYEAIEKFGEIIQGKGIDFSYSHRPFDHFLKKYNVKGNLIEWKLYNSDGSLKRKETYKYDDKGNLIKSNEYNSDGSFDKKCIYKHDDKGKKIEKNCYNLDGSLDYKYIYKYDDKGNGIESNEYNSDGSLKGKVGYKYDDKGNNIEINMVVSKFTYKYDDKGILIERNDYNSDGILYRKFNYKYEYDEESNWVKKIEFRGMAEIPEEITIRTIEYY